MFTVAEAILFLIKNAPAGYAAAKQIYTSVKADLSTTEQGDIDAALAAAQANDAKKTSEAVAALDQAAKT